MINSLTTLPPVLGHHPILALVIYLKGMKDDLFSLKPPVVKTLNFVLIEDYCLINKCEILSFEALLCMKFNYKSKMLWISEVIG